MNCAHCSANLTPGARVCGGCRALQPISVHPGTVTAGSTLDLGYGRVVVDARLGQGGMGVVWRGWLFHSPSGPRANEPPLPLALKVLLPRAGEQADVRTLFSNEAEALRSLNHANIVRFLDFFEWGGALCLAMELVQGSTLSDLIGRHRARAAAAGPGAHPGVSMARAWYYFQQLLGALGATHALGVVHRDVKPSNVLIRTDGIVKLSDFGIARLMRDVAVGANSYGGAALALGTGAYMSPEQVLSRPVDARSDVYSAAIVFYETLAGRPPFSPEELNEFSLRQAHVESAPPPLGQFVPDAPPSLEAVLSRALAKEPRYRFASALQLGDALRLALGEAETAEWEALRDIVHAAPIPAGTAEASARAVKLQTLHDFVLQRFVAANPAR